MAYAHQGVELRSIPGIASPTGRPAVAETKQNGAPEGGSPSILTKGGTDALLRIERRMDDAARVLATTSGEPSKTTDAGGAAAQRRGSFFDDRSIDPRKYAKVPSIHKAIRDHGGRSYIVEPEIFRNEAMTRMHAAEATYIGYLLPSTMGVRVRQLLDGRAEDDSPLYIYAYWAGVDTVAHWYGPRGPEHAAEAALLDRDLERALGDRDRGDTLVILTADHGHASVDPARLIDLEADRELRALLRNPIAGEPRLVFLHTDRSAEVKAYLEHAYPGTFLLIDRD